MEDQVHRRLDRKQKLGGGPKKWDYWLVDTESWSRKHRTWANVVRVIDKFRNRYEERVTLPEGQVVHEEQEQLTAHTGHGAAKPTRPEANP